MIKNFQQQLNEFEQKFEKLSQTQFDEDNDIGIIDVQKLPSYQAYWQACNQLNLWIRDLRKQDKTAFSNEVKEILKLWANHSGCWIDKVIEEDLLDKLIDEGFLLPQEIEVYHRNTCYRQG